MCAGEDKDYFRHLPRVVVDLQPIASHSQIKAAVHGRFVHVRGPCGAAHIMSFAEARALREWLAEKVPSELEVEFYGMAT